MRKSRKNKKDFFWVSYSDLMTSLFFVMLVLFVLVYALQATNIKKLEENKEELINQKALLINQKALLEKIQDSLKNNNKDLLAAKEELDLIKEIKKALDNLDPRYFSYNEKYKKHVLNIPNIEFAKGKSNMMFMSGNTRIKIRDAGEILKKLMNQLPKRDNIRYLLVIEGQASKDDYSGNDELSYRRAIALRNFWFGLNPNLNNVLPNCEVIIAGSGQYGVPRITPDRPPANQRFLITIIPKIGKLK